MKRFFAFIVALLFLSMFAYSLFGEHWSFDGILLKLQRLELDWDISWLFQQVQKWKEISYETFYDIKWNYNLVGIQGFFLNIWNILSLITKILFSTWLSLLYSSISFTIYYVDMIFTALRIVGVFFLPLFS